MRCDVAAAAVAEQSGWLGSGGGGMQGSVALAWRKTDCCSLLFFRGRAGEAGLMSGGRKLRQRLTLN